MEDQIRMLQLQVQQLLQGTGQRFQTLEQQAGEAVQQLGEQVQQTQGAVQMANKSTLRLPLPPKFHGVREGPRVLEWCHAATTYLKAAGADQDERGVWHISNFFEGDAAVWWRLYCDKVERQLAPQPKIWEHLKVLLIDQFQVFNHITDVKDRYQALKQVGTVSAYITKFRALVVELPNETEENQIYQFLKGLKPEIQARTRTHKPLTLAAAMDIADEADRANLHAYRGFSSRLQSDRPAFRQTTSQAQPMQIGAISGNGEAASKARTEINALTPVPPHIIQRLRQENRCFYCRKVGHAARDCAKKKRDVTAARKSQKPRRVPEN
jgi:hypothetical protein